MPASETIYISFGNWIAAFYVVYAMAALAVVAASTVLVDWTVSKLRASRVAAGTKTSRRAQVAESRA